MRRDPSFPRPRQIGSEFSVGWLRREVMEWLNSRPRAEFNGLDAVERRRRGSGAINSPRPPVDQTSRTSAPLTIGSSQTG
ncbi:MAG: AlpA family phage regulatory protein [Betaproteobacteria bacterium]|nr:AlpA family phage regulatory protein [Betaproteobacteria bacterium]